MNIVARGINDAFLKVVKALHESGSISAPRGKQIKEIKNMSIEIENPKRRILTLPIRKISLPFAFGEWVWYMMGRNDVDTMGYYSRMMKNFSDDGKTLNSAYGYRMFGGHPMLPFDQWQFVIDKLKEDPDSRQAVIHLHTPNNKPTKDEVCTLSLQFLIRDGRLDMIVNMRSNDIVWGFTYDMFSFTSFQELMANELEIEVGTYYHNAASMHIYDKDYFYFDYLPIYPELMHMTSYDQEFDYKGLTRHCKELKALYACEFENRNIMSVNRKDEFGNKALSIMAEVFYQYGIYKGINNDNDGREEIIDDLQYDDIYHCMMRNYMTPGKVMESNLMIFEGPDGAGKTTKINELMNDYQDIETIAFTSPDESFDKQIYFYTALMSGNIILDRFYQSEWTYSRILERECRIGWEDVDALEIILNFRKASYILFNTDPDLCYERLDDKDREFFTKDQIRRISDSYELTFRVSKIQNKKRLSEM